MNYLYIKGMSLTSFGVIVLSFDALLIRLIGDESSSIIFWRGILLSLIIFIGLKLTSPKTAIIRTDWRYIRSALFFAASSICFVLAINSTSVANVLVIISIQPLLAALLAWIFLKEKSPLITWIAICISLLGVIWVFYDSWQQTNLTGDFLALICGLLIAAKFVNDRGEKEYSMIPALFAGGLFMAIFAYFVTDSIRLEKEQWGWVTILCLFILPTAFISITQGLKYLSAPEVAMLMLLETVIGPIWVWLFLSLKPNQSAIEGGSIVVITLIGHSLLRYKMDQKKHKKLNHLDLPLSVDKIKN